MDKLRIQRYYDKTLPFYRLFWHGDSGSNALHCGFWDSQTKTIHEALLNQDKFLAEQIDLKPGDKVLDAGCGIGGSSTWLSQHYDAIVVGITLSTKQAACAHAWAKTKGVSPLATFYAMDFCQTGFHSNSFDIVWATESVCHAEHKEEFLKEAHRVLKCGGKIIVADGFLKRQTRNPREERLLNHFLHGFAVPNLATIDGFEQSLYATGFKNIQCWDKTNDIKPSSRRMYVMCLISHYVFQIGQLFTAVDEILRNSVLAGIAQYKAVKADLCGYLVFYGQK
jgi:tocopherol O-methyltransferase